MNGQIQQDNEFFDKICKMWDDGESQKDVIDEYYKWWDGSNFKSSGKGSKRTPNNIIKQIIESKLSDTLDAQFTASVVPSIFSFSDLQNIQDLQDIADVLDKGLKKVLARQGQDGITDEGRKEQVARWGFIKFGASQVNWDNDLNDITDEVIDPRNLKWTKGAKSIKELTWIGYSKDLNISQAKQKYARNAMGGYDLEFCKKLDEAAGERIEKVSNAENKGIGAYQVNSGGDYKASAGLAYIKDSSKNGSEKTIPIVVMFAYDGTLETPEQDDSQEELTEKSEMQMKYPNGRILVFVPDKSKKIMLDDRPAPQAFKSLGNIDIFNILNFDSFYKGGEVEDLIPIQERIDGTSRKKRLCIGSSINTVLFDERHRGVVEDSSFVNEPVKFVEGLGDFQPPVLNNGMIDEAAKLTEMIGSYAQDAREQGRINAAFMTGENQDGVKSGDHADSLNESAMKSIRSIQRNFTNYYVSKCEKIVALMIENYSVGRLIELATGVGQKKYAVFDSQSDEQGQEQKSIKFLDEVGKIIKEIKIDPSWKWQVEVTDGTKIPRSRRENARLVDEVAANPIMQSGNIPMITMYLKFKDFPNWREVVDLLKEQQQQAQKNPVPMLKQLTSNPALLQAAGAFFKDLTGYPNAQGQLLKMLGLDGTAGDLTTLPASEITSKSSVKDVALMTPQQISQDKEQALFGHAQATDLEILQHKVEPKREMQIIQ